MTRAEELAEKVRLDCDQALENAIAHAEALAEALEAIKTNAESWHGPPSGASGHVRALTVIAKTADNALARYRGEKEVKDGNTARA